MQKKFYMAHSSFLWTETTHMLYRSEKKKMPSNEEVRGTPKVSDLS